MLIDCSDIQLHKLKSKNDFENQVLNFLNQWFDNTEFVQVKTSGSTGEPKTFDIEKSKMINSAAMTTGFLNLKKGDIALLCLPVEYISGKMMLVRAIFQKLKIIIKEPTLSPLKDIDHEIDFCAMTPLQVENSLDKIHLIKKLIIGGAAVSQGLRDKLSVYPTEIYETYGMSETLSHIALKKIAPSIDDYFTAFDDVEIFVDERGCLRIVAPKLNPEVLQTNDLVKIVNDRQFLFLGRVDNVINTGGVKVFPEQLEALVKKELSNEVVFMGLNDDYLGQKLIAVVEGVYNVEINDIVVNMDYGNKIYKPKEVIFVVEIPRTPNGKVSRLELKKILESR